MVRGDIDMWAAIIPYIMKLFGGSAGSSLASAATTQVAGDTAANIANGAMSGNSVAGMAGNASQGNWASALGGLTNSGKAQPPGYQPVQSQDVSNMQQYQQQRRYIPSMRG